jgi:glutamine synthetase
MPKPLYGDNGSGMHCHQSLWKDGKPLFAGQRLRGHERDGDVLHRRHPQARPALNAITNPTTNSYRRLVPGYEAPVNLAYSLAQPLGVDPHPDVLASPKAKRIEVRFPDPELQPLPRVRGDDDGGPRRHREEDRSRRPLDKDIYSLSPEELQNVPHVPARSTRRSTRSRRTTSSSSRGTSSPRTSSRVGELQAPEGSRPGPPPPDALEYQMYYDV